MRNQRGMVMVVALGVMIALAAMSLAIARSGQMSTLTGSLSAQTANAFYLADGAAYHALGDPAAELLLGDLRAVLELGSTCLYPPPSGACFSLAMHWILAQTPKGNSVIVTASCGRSGSFNCAKVRGELVPARIWPAGYFEIFP